MDPNDLDLSLASIATIITGFGALYVSLQELSVHQRQVSVEERKLTIESNDAAVRANEASVRANAAQFDIIRHQCDIAREIYSQTARNRAIPTQMSNKLSQQAANTLMGCTGSSSKG